MERSPTANVILGMLGWRPMSGYEIKSIVDKSTRFFWAVSYGQLYPELRRLSTAGLIEGKASPQGSRKRNVYRLTAAGRKELRAWLEAEPQVYELRDEGLLKLFFASSTDGESAPRTLEAMARGHRQLVEQLRLVGAERPPEGFPNLILTHGIEFHQWVADWCDRTRRALKEEAAGERRIA